MFSFPSFLHCILKSFSIIYYVHRQQFRTLVWLGFNIVGLVINLNSQKWNNLCKCNSRDNIIYVQRTLKTNSTQLFWINIWTKSNFIHTLFRVLREHLILNSNAKYCDLSVHILGTYMAICTKYKTK